MVVAIQRNNGKRSYQILINALNAKDFGMKYQRNQIDVINMYGQKTT